MGKDKMQLIKVSDNRRFLAKEDGTPFFWLADTVWELFHKLNREEAELFLKNRAERKFTVIQAVALAEFDGVAVGNFEGRKPLLMNEKGEYDPTLPDTGVDEKGNAYSYWDHMDYIIETAEALGLYIALLPTWGDKFNQIWGKGPVIFNSENALKYGKWLGERYSAKSNIIWVLGGDRPLYTANHFNIVNSMAEGLKIGDGGKHIMTYHPDGGKSSSLHMHDEKWLDFNMIQSGHGSLNIDNYNMIKADYDRLPVKPIVDGEPRYEDHPIGFKPENGYFDDFDTRQGAYWSVFAGSFGHTYGHHSIWSMCTEPAAYFPMTWQVAAVRPGANQMQHLRSLIESRPFFERVPDQELIAENYEGANHLQGTCGKGYAFIYSPNGLCIKVNMGRISGSQVKAYWFDPREGTSSVIGEYENKGTVAFTPPSSGRRNDWVLVLEDKELFTNAPGR